MPHTRLARPARRRARIAAFCALIVSTALLAGCLGAEGLSPLFNGRGSVRYAGGVRVLFVGNSLTYFNDLGAMVAAVAHAAGDTAVRTATVAYPDYALEDHIAEGTAVRALRDARWEYVVMQQGPSSLPENQLLLWKEVSDVAVLCLCFAVYNLLISRSLASRSELLLQLLRRRLLPLR